ncbi:MAG TPA: hypothetical protein VFT22_39680 [Kofleriaceae bacterium]|nr:hypothetical protein [Kofleriaceae bacterium]
MKLSVVASSPAPSQATRRAHLGVSLAAGIAAASLGAGVARADDGIPPAPPAMDTSSAVNPVSMVTGAGVTVGEGTVLHPQVGIETGVISNVFYQPNGPVMAGLLRILAEIGTSSLPSQRLTLGATAVGGQDPSAAQMSGTASGDFKYSADLYASWDQYLSTNDNVNAQGGLGGGLLLRGIVNPEHPLQFSFQEHFNRVIRATNFESQADTNRDVNTLSLRLNYVPYGRSINAYLYYQNLIDVFEASSQQFANRLHNTLGLRVNWQWLPLTQVFVDVSGGFNTGLGSSEKVNSLPVTATAGIQTALTLNTTLNAYAGYTNGFYASGPSYSALAAGVMFGYRYSPLGRITGLYSYEHQDSINANFYRDHVVQATLEHLFVPFLVFARPELRLRRYEGTLIMGTTGNTRDDTIYSATVGMRYAFRDWIAGTLDYELQSVQTDFRYQVDGLVLDPSYVRHELMVGVRAAY